MRLPGLILATTVVTLLSVAAPTAAASADVRAVSSPELAEAMRSRSHGDYNLAATTNGPRFQTDAFFFLARRALAAQPQGCRLFISHEDWFHVFLEVAQLKPEEAAIVTRMIHDNGQDIELDCRPQHVVKAVRQGPPVRLAINVKYWWELAANPADHFTYIDEAATPVLKVTNNRVITYRLVDLGEQIVFDEIRGLTGRPTSGFLGLLFKVIGDGRIVKSQMAWAADSVQVSRVVAQKLFTRTVTVITSPDGRTEAEAPAGRADLATLKARLDQPLEIEYYPLTP